MSEQGTKKQSDTQFICKLCDMIQKYPNTINWNQDGKKMIIFNIQKMESLVLPQYFRHSNFPSFIRQLNMYDFHKLYKKDNEIAFRNEIFIRGNEKNFHFIQRKKKIKEHCLLTMQFQKKTESILKRLNQEDKIPKSTKEAIHSLMEFKYVSYENTKKIRQELQKVIKQLKDCRSKKIAENIKTLKNHLEQNMANELKLSKDIDQALENTFLVEKENKEILGNMPLSHIVGSQFHFPIFGSEKHGPKQLFFDSRMRSHSSFVAFQSHCGLLSFNEIQHPLFYSTPKIYESIVNEVQKTITKQEEPDSENQDDSLSMGRIGEEQLQQILKTQKDKPNHAQAI